MVERACKIIIDCDPPGILPGGVSSWVVTRTFTFVVKTSNEPPWWHEIPEQPEDEDQFAAYFVKGTATSNAYALTMLRRDSEILTVKPVALGDGMTEYLVGASDLLAAGYPIIVRGGYSYPKLFIAATNTTPGMSAVFQVIKKEPAI